MGRLRQYNANRYQSSEAVQAEFENLVRYLNSAELGNLTLRELLGKVFDDNGEISLGIEFRYDAVNGLEVSVGDSDVWTKVVAADDIRGAPGVSLGSIDGPVYFNRSDIVATDAQTVFPYIIASDAADLVVFVNGLLQAQNSYAYSKVANTVTLAAQTAGAIVTIYSIRNNASSTFRRTDFSAGSNQVVFPFPHTADEIMQVYRNGILQREGSGYDYIQSEVTGTITMTTAQPANTLISAIVVQNDAIRDVLGLMLEDRYATNGLIRYDRIAIADDQIPTSKVNGLSAAFDLKGDMYVGASEPAGVIRAGSLWINTSRAVPALMFNDGTRWLDPSPEGLLPSPEASDALKFLRLNSTISGYELVNLDFSGLVATSAIGAQNGVASLDSAGLVPTAQVPTIHRRASFNGKIDGAVANGTYTVALVAGQKYSFDSASYLLDGGTATVQLRIGGADFGLTSNIGTASVGQVWSAVVANAIAAGLPVQLVITNSTGATGLSWNVQGTILQ